MFLVMVLMKTSGMKTPHNTKGVFMKKMILLFPILISACATTNKCGLSKYEASAIYDSSSCFIYIRSPIYLDQVSPAMAEKIKQGSRASIRWQKAQTKDSSYVPAHAEVVLESDGD